MLRARQMIMCQVTKNPIGAKGARLTQEVSLPGRFVVLIPNSNTYGISKRLPDDIRKRLRNILDRVKPEQHGLIVRTAAEHATDTTSSRHDRCCSTSGPRSSARRRRPSSPTLLYREPELAVRVIREEFNPDYRGVVIDDHALFEQVRDYVAAFNPELADRIEYYDAAAEGLPLFERFHIHEQVHKALDRKVWLPSGGSLIIEHTEALTVIDVNTGKNVGKSNLEETVFHNNIEAAEEIAKQLRLRDIGGIIVIDFIDMEIKANRAQGGRRLPGRARPGQDPHAGVRHLRARPGRDDPQAHRRGPADRVRRAVPQLRRPRRPRRPRPARVTVRVAALAIVRLDSPLLRRFDPIALHGYVRSDRLRWQAGEGDRGPAGGVELLDGERAARSR